MTYKSDTTTIRDVVPQVENAPGGASSTSGAVLMAALPSARAVAAAAAAAVAAAAAAAAAVWAGTLESPRSVSCSSLLVSCFSSCASVRRIGDDEDRAGCPVFPGSSSLIMIGRQDRAEEKASSPALEMPCLERTIDYRERTDKSVFSHAKGRGAAAFVADVIRTPAPARRTHNNENSMATLNGQE